MKRKEIVELAERLHDVLGAMNLADKLNAALTSLKGAQNSEDYDVSIAVRIEVNDTRVFSTKIASDVCPDSSMQAIIGETLSTVLLTATMDALEEYHTRLSDGIAAFKVPTC